MCAGEAGGLRALAVVPSHISERVLRVSDQPNATEAGVVLWAGLAGVTI